MLNDKDVYFVEVPISVMLRHRRKQLNMLNEYLIQMAKTEFVLWEIKVDEYKECWIK